MSARGGRQGGGGGLLLLVTLAVGLWWLHSTDPALFRGLIPTAAAPSASTVAVGDIPAGYLAQYRQAGSTCAGLDWALLAGIGKVETNHGRAQLPGVASGTNYAGAAGPMQFLAATWRQVRAGHPDVGGNVYNPGDAIPGAAHYLCDSGLSGRGTRAALWSYNHSTTYADQVLALAARYRAAGWPMSTALDTRRAGSAYPVPVAELTGRVRDQANALGAFPSLRQVMTAHRVGRPKAAAALDALRTGGFSPAPTTSPADTVAPEEVPEPPVTDAPPTDSPAEHVPVVEPVTVEAPVIDAGPAAGNASEVSATTARREHDPAGPADASPLLMRGVDASGRWRTWPLILISLGAFVSIWGGWVGLGELTGFGPIRLLPGIADQVVINSAITLPIGVEAYAAFALRAWLAPGPAVSARARRFARWSTVGALALGAAGQIAYHLMIAAGVAAAPWPITAFVSCLPVLVLGCGAALTHLTHHPTTR